MFKHWSFASIPLHSFAYAISFVCSCACVCCVFHLFLVNIYSFRLAPVERSLPIVLFCLFHFVATQKQRVHVAYPLRLETCHFNCGCRWYRVCVCVCEQQGDTLATVANIRNCNGKHRKDSSSVSQCTFSIQIERTIWNEWRSCLSSKFFLFSAVGIIQVIPLASS